MKNTPPLSEKQISSEIEYYRSQLHLLYGEKAKIKAEINTLKEFDKQLSQRINYLLKDIEDVVKQKAACN